MRNYVTERSGIDALVLELVIFNWILGIMFVTAVGVFILLFFKTAPYDRHLRKGWGPEVDNSWGWVIMEVPASIVFIIIFTFGEKMTLVPFIILLMFTIHYFYRGFIFPFQLRGKTKMPLTIALFGAIFNTVNGYLNARWLYTLSPNPYPVSWLLTPQFIIGFFIFYGGVGINLHSDHITRVLRSKGEKEMKWIVPDSGLHKYVASPNYLGEITEWLGWAITFSRTD